MKQYQKIIKLQKNLNQDLTNRKFGKLTVIGESCIRFTNRKGMRWVCKCDCDNHTIIEVDQQSLLNGHCNNCGCSNKNDPIDMTGLRYGSLEVLERVDDKSLVPENMRNRGVLWRCKCDCGNEVILTGASIRSRGNSACCEECKNALAAYGLSHSKIYIAYRNMKRRCTDPNDPTYNDYGGRGIKICEEWKDKRNSRGQNEGFLRFYNWAVKNGGEYGELTLDREDNEEGYSPNNCRFVTMKTQCNNTRANRIITYNGESKTSTEFAESIKMNPSTFRDRLNSGMSIDEAINKPIQKEGTSIVSSLGESHTSVEWSKISGISHNTIFSRVVRRNWDPNIAVTKGATNPDVYNHIPYGLMSDGMYMDILGNKYTKEEWNSHQAISFDE